MESLIPSELDEVVVHEICHILVSEMRMWAPLMLKKDASDQAMMHEESTVTMMTRSILHLGEIAERWINTSRMTEGATARSMEDGA